MFKEIPLNETKVIESESKDKQKQEHYNLAQNLK